MGGNGDGAELDLFHRLPGFLVAFFDRDPMESHLFEGAQECPLLIGAGDASRPQFRVLRHMGGHFPVADDIGNGDPSARPQHPVDLAEKLGLVFGAHQI